MLSFLRQLFSGRSNSVRTNINGDERKKALRVLVDSFLDRNYEAAFTLGMRLMGQHASFQVLQITVTSLQRLEPSGRNDPNYLPLLNDVSEFALNQTKEHPYHNALLQLTLGRIKFDRVAHLASSPIEQCKVHYYEGLRAVTLNQLARAHTHLFTAFKAGAVCFEACMAAGELLSTSTQSNAIPLNLKDELRSLVKMMDRLFDT